MVKMEEIIGEMLMMEIEMGAAVFIISDDTYRKKFGKLMLAESVLRVAHTTQGIQVCGEVWVSVRLGEQERQCID